MERRLMVRVLGPIELITPEGPMPVGGRRLRALLGALVLGAGHAVPCDHLGAVLWGDEPPPTAANALQSYVSGLRHLLGSDAIVRTDHSYELDVGRVDVDAMQFEELLRRAEATRDDPAACWQLCHDALRLWHGRPFGDLADDDPFALEAYRLDELRLVTMELSMEADLALGRHELIVSELENAVREHPFRERLWYLLVEALASADRRVEALRACTQLRQILGEVGIGVGDEIAGLEREILDGSFTAAPAP